VGLVLIFSIVGLGSIIDLGSTTVSSIGLGSTTVSSIGLGSTTGSIGLGQTSAFILITSPG
jgi:hypothetical protein